jgi:hypothetical protein
LKFVEAHIYDRSILIGLDGKKLLHRLPQADSFKDMQVHAEDDGIESSGIEIIHEETEYVLEGKHSIDATTKTTSTRGQQENSKIDACQTRQYKGRNKHKGKRSKVTFKELLEKYTKESEESCAYQPSSAKASRSPSRQKTEDRDWQRSRFNAATSYPPFGTQMPTSSMAPCANFYPYPSWGRYDSREHHQPYFKPSHQTSAAPMRSSVDHRLYVKDRLNESVQSSRKNNEVKQL